MDTKYVVYDNQGKAQGVQMDVESRNQLLGVLKKLSEIYDTVSDMTGIFPYDDDSPLCQIEGDKRHSDDTLCDYCGGLAFDSDRELQALAHWLYYDILDGNNEEEKERGINWFSMYRTRVDNPYDN